MGRQQKLHRLLAKCIGALVSEKNKHIDLKYDFVKDHVQLGTMKLRYLPTGDMVDDMLTKPVPGHALVKHRSAILGTSGPMQRYTSSRVIVITSIRLQDTP
jgi:hypothetical protein